MSAEMQVTLRTGDLYYGGDDGTAYMLASRNFDGSTMNYTEKRAVAARLHAIAEMIDRAADAERDRMTFEPRLVLPEGSTP